MSLLRSITAQSNDGSSIDTLVRLLTPLHTCTDDQGKSSATGSFSFSSSQKSWDFEPSSEEKSATGFVGIRNLGCTCYINSTVQQLFMVPAIRDVIFKIPSIQAMSNRDLNECMVYQLQSVLAQLQESERMYANLAGFAHAFKDWEGNPTNVREQMDAQEFFNLLLDRLDSHIQTELKSTSGAIESDSKHDLKDEKESKDGHIPQNIDRNAIKNLIGGVLSNEFICKGCPHYREREEEFFTVGLEIKNKRNLQVCPILLIYYQL
jgi:ubiquitin C-terminal hydrolase